LSEELFSLIPQMFIAIFALMNPFSLLGIYLDITQKFSESYKKKLLLVMVIAVNIILLTFLFGGEELLGFFGVDLAGFTVAGGIIIFIMGLSMVRAKQSEVHHTSEEGEEAKSTESPASVGVVPLAIPILAGPGTISVVINNAHTFNSLTGDLAIVIGIVLVSIIVYFVFRFGTIIAKKLGKTGMNIITRIMGLILMAMAFDMMAKGLTGLFPALG